jgi:predicted nucleic acid-binding protein
MRMFSDEQLTREDFEEPAEAGNTCRNAGVAGSAVDLLICAAAPRLGCEIFTTDEDFRRYASHLPIRLHVVGAAQKT